MQANASKAAHGGEVAESTKALLREEINKNQTISNSAPGRN